MKILLAGGTGLVGSALLPLLHDQNVTAIGRREVNGANNLTGPVEQWPALIEGHRFDAAISTLGTTIRQAGSQPAFRAIDYEAVVAVANAAKEVGARRFMMVSSVGARANASNFYLRTKGEAEEAVKALGFDRIDIMRPGLLRGERGGPPRFGERIAIAASPITDLLTPASFDQYRSIAAADVARAMAALLRDDGSGIVVHHNRDMLRLAARLP